MMQRKIVLVKQKIISLIIKYPVCGLLILYKFMVLTSSLVFTPIPSRKAMIKRIVWLVIFNLSNKTMTKRIFIYLYVFDKLILFDIRYRYMTDDIVITMLNIPT